MAKMTFRSDDHSPEEGEWKTFKEWEELGYGVIKGKELKDLFMVWQFFTKAK